MTYLDPDLKKQLKEAKKELARVTEERDSLHFVVHECVDRVRELMSRIEALEEELSKKPIY